ncbi:hypothetical protein BD770DRAFT_414904 [Pilaira anomala]|nr:hypothetical protein BD770DRAFT_414904 [Pilaira anomala]
MFFAVEVSGPRSVVSNIYFVKDRKKLAKNLKLILNIIYKCNIFAGSNIKRTNYMGFKYIYGSIFEASIWLLAGSTSGENDVLNCTFPGAISARSKSVIKLFLYQSGHLIGSIHKEAWYQDQVYADTRHLTTLREPKLLPPFTRA